MMLKVLLGVYLITTRTVLIVLELGQFILRSVELLLLQGERCTPLGSRVTRSDALAHVSLSVGRGYSLALF